MCLPAAAHSSCCERGRVCRYALVQVDMSDLEGAFLNVASQCMSVLMLDVNTRLDAGLQVCGGQGEGGVMIAETQAQEGRDRPGGAGEGAADEVKGGSAGRGGGGIVWAKQKSAVRVSLSLAAPACLIHCH